MAVESNYVLQRTFINFIKHQFQTGLTKNPKKWRKSAKNFIILGSKTPKNDLLTLNYGLPSSFTTLSTWETTKRGPLMKLDVRWALPVYPVWKLKGMKTSVKTSYKNKKRQSTNTIQFLDCKKKTAPQYNSNSLNCKKICRISILLFES